jgi:hypothetical protein
MKRLRKRNDDEDDDKDEEDGSRTIFVKRSGVNVSKKQSATTLKRPVPLLSVAGGADIDEQAGESNDLLPSLQRKRKQQPFAIPSDIKSRLTSSSSSSLVQPYLSSSQPPLSDNNIKPSVSAYSAEGLRLLRAQQTWLDRPLGEDVVNREDNEEDVVGGGGKRDGEKLGTIDINGLANMNGKIDENEEMMGEEAEAMLYQTGSSREGPPPPPHKRNFTKDLYENDVKGKESTSSKYIYGSERSITPPPQAPPGTVRSNYLSYTDDFGGNASGDRRLEISADPDAALSALKENIANILSSSERSVKQLNEEVTSLDSQRTSLQTQLTETNAIIADASVRFDLFRGLLTQAQNASQLVSEITNLSVYNRIQSSLSSSTTLSSTAAAAIDAAAEEENDSNTQASMESALRQALFGDSVAQTDKVLFQKEIESFVEKVSLEDISKIARDTSDLLSRWKSHPNQKINASYPMDSKAEALVDPLLAFVNVVSNKCEVEVEMDVSA